MSLMDAQKDRAEKGPGKLKRNLEQRQLLLEAERWDKKHLQLIHKDYDYRN
ncbi:hypothetical protein ACJJIP_00705 [Microbulbifer sp. VTAC004]|uniref:hypothetical protein n=1 Tax=Microbulbifer sp. VTAC004 TaxID=3243386 RepID=UPI00403A6CC4